MNNKLKVVGGAIALAVGLIVFVIAAAVANGTLVQTPATPQEVKIDNFTFAPADVTVAQRTTVHWKNHDDIPHTVVSDDKSTFKSKPLDTDQEFSYTFTKPGTYSYFCSIHPKMTGKIIVQ